MMTYSRKARLLRILSSDRCPDILKTTWTSVQRRLRIETLDLSDHTTSATSTIHEHQLRTEASNLHCLDNDIHQAFASMLQKDANDITQVFLHHEYRQGNVLYSDFCTSLKHSIVYFYSGARRASTMKPAQIRAIFSYKHRDRTGQLLHEVFFAVHEYIASDINPFSAYPDFRAGLFGRDPDHTVQVIRATQVHCHGNQLLWDSDLVVMRAIDRVSLALNDYIPVLTIRHTGLLIYVLGHCQEDSVYWGI
jgi:hypothetical protein